MEFGQAHAVLSAPNYAFRGLSAAERRTLSHWLAAVRSAGVDAAEDLGERPWAMPAADTIIGVFRSGHLLASWLVIGQSGSWAVACCADGAVSEACDSLAEALALVCKPRAGGTG
jgi:anti-sigma factor RsiW